MREVVLRLYDDGRAEFADPEAVKAWAEMVCRVVEVHVRNHYPDLTFQADVRDRERALIAAAVEDARAELDRLKADYIETTLAVLRERERCAKVVEDYTYPDPDYGTEQITDEHLIEVARRIREGSP